MIAEYAANMSEVDKIYIFYQPTDVYSRAGVDAFNNKFNMPVIKVPVNSRGDFDVKILDKLKTEHSLIIFFTYPLPSAQIIVKLDAHHLITNRVHVIGSSSWMFDVSVFRPIKKILRNAHSIYVSSLSSHKEIERSDFYKNFFHRYRRAPNTIELINYDMGRLTAECYQLSFSHNMYIQDLFLKCMNNSKHQGVAGAFEYNDFSPFSIRSVKMIDFIDEV